MTTANSHKVTLTDVANMAGVCKSTASRILSATPAQKTPFDPETQVRVHRAADVLGYVPSKLARGLTTAKTHTVGLIVPSIEDSFFPKVTSVIETRLAECGYTILLANTQAKSAIERNRIESLLAWQVDGLMIVPCQENSDMAIYWDLWRKKLPFVLIDRLFVDTPFYSVTTDDCVGTTTAVEHLIALGRKRIATIGGPMTVYTNRLRNQGYRETMARHGLPIDPNWLVETPASHEGGRMAARRLLAQTPRPDAILCFSDLLAMGAMEECFSQGIRLPEELAMIGYADLDYAKMLRIPLTTVRQPKELLGVAAANMLLSQLDDHVPETPQTVLPTELVIRESTAAAIRRADV